MISYDTRGVPFTGAGTVAIEHYENALAMAVGFAGDPISEVAGALQTHENFIMGHCLTAGLLAIGTEKAALPVMRDSVECAERHWAQANDRERGHITALKAWLEGDFDQAVTTWGRVLVNWPRDLLALLLAHQGDFLLGQSQWLRDRVAQVQPDWSESVPGYGYVLGMHAFGLEETGDYQRAEQVGHRAVEHNPRDVWGIHAVAHVYEMQGETREGIDWLTQRMGDWAIDNALAYHNYWHLALYHLDNGDLAQVLKLYDQAIRPADSRVVMEMVDASALLWRLHLRGVDVRTRWLSLQEAWMPLIDDGHYAFNDVHAMMSFVATGADACARRLLANLERRAQGTGHNAVMTRDVGLPVAQALQAFGMGHYARATELLLKVRPVAHRFGGSHAQRDVLALTLQEAALRSGQYPLARAISAERTDLKPGSPFNWLMQSRAEGLLGKTASGDRSRERANQLLRTVLSS